MENIPKSKHNSRGMIVGVYANAGFLGVKRDGRVLTSVLSSR